MLAANSVSSRRKQAKPQRLSNENDLNVPSISSKQLDCHRCGICSANFFDVETFIEHKRTCRGKNQSSATPPCSDSESIPIDLSRRTLLDDLGKKDVSKDKSSAMTNSSLRAFQHQQQLLDLYAQLAASQNHHNNIDSEQSSEDGANTSCILSPPSSNDMTEKIHNCAAERCFVRFASKGALLWHTLSRHPHEKLLQCNTCEERLADLDQVHEHKCGVPPRPLSSEAQLRSSSPDADRGSVPARTNGKFNIVMKKPRSSTLDGLDALNGTPLSQMLFSQLLSSASMQSNGVSVKDGALDLTTSVPSQVLPMSTVPQQLMRPTFNFDMQSRRPLPSREVLMGTGASSSLLNNDDDWETLMEVSTTDETEKIRALVGDKPLPTTDPNQCLLCRRVLSCKSALQMHYRTHTGERPFKCKICQRAFTTKGNLKTHMGVHRAKHSFRGVAASSSVQHQCPICQKRFFTMNLLQQHIAQHTSQLTRNGLLTSFEGSNKFDHRPLPLHLVPSISAQVANNPETQSLPYCSSSMPMQLATDVPMPFSAPFPFFGIGIPRHLSSSMNYPAGGFSSPYLTHASGSGTVISGIHPDIDLSPSDVYPHCDRPNEFIVSSNSMSATCKSDSAFVSNESDAEGHDSKLGTLFNSSFLSAFDMSSRPMSLNSPLKMACEKHCKENVSTEKEYNTYSQTNSDIPGLISSKMCGNEFPVNNNHTRISQREDYRKLSKQKGLTKNDAKRIFSQQLQSSVSTSDDYVKDSNQATGNCSSFDHSKENGSLLDEDCQEKLDEKMPSTSNAIENPLDAMHKMWAETEPPPPRQVPVLSKHQCGVCFKHFSSSSALQIHMRTHTGDKPFKCEVCSRAFTTRGNLKVHMGTHVWQQNPSRRESPIRIPFETSIRPSIGETSGNHPSPFPVLPYPLPLVPSATSGTSTNNQMEAMVWMWKTICSVCQKVCATPHELEHHLKMHLTGTHIVQPRSPAILLQKSD